MIALIGKSNTKGLGILTREWAEHLPIDKVWCKLDQMTEKVDSFNYFNDDKQIDLNGIKTIILLETPYQDLLRRCREQGVKTILKVNYEFLPTNLKHEPDVYLCSSTLNYQESPDPKVLIEDPVDTEKIKFKQRDKANVFVHNAGTLGIGGANGTQELLDAIPKVKSDVKFIIRSQKPIKINDPRVDLRVGNVPNYWEMYDEGDVFVSPQKFRATSLPIQEAMASGMPVLCTDIPPFNEFVSYTFAYKEKRREMLSRMVNFYVPDVDSLANKIDELAGQDISKQSKQSREYAESISWNNLNKKICNLL